MICTITMNVASSYSTLYSMLLAITSQKLLGHCKQLAFLLYSDVPIATDLSPYQNYDV